MPILVIEDDPLIREFVVEALGVEGDDVVHASNGKEALARCNRQAADILVTDIQLPGDDGWQIAERCREHDPGLPAILRDRLLTVQAGPVASSYPCRSSRGHVKAVKDTRRERRTSRH